MLLFTTYMLKHENIEMFSMQVRMYVHMYVPATYRCTDHKQVNQTQD